MNKSIYQGPVMGCSRRQFIKRTSAAVLLGSLAPAGESVVGAAQTAANNAPAKKALAGSNIYGWGQYYQRDGKNVGEHIDEVLSALRDAGYDYLENFMDTGQPENNARFAEQLKAKGLRPVSLYTGGRLHEEGRALETVHKLLETAKACREAGFSLISCNPDPIGREKTDEELKTQAAALTELGKGLKVLGMKLGIHHHLPEMANNAREFHYTFGHTDSELVGFCYDVHWVYKGGVAPIDALKAYSNRIVSWHLRQSRNGIWWEDLDTGDIDYEEVARFAKEHKLSAVYTVELALEAGTKITRSVVENHRRSREFVRRVFED